MQDGRGHVRQPTRDRFIMLIRSLTLGNCYIVFLE